MKLRQQRDWWALLFWLCVDSESDSQSPSGHSQHSDAGTLKPHQSQAAAKHHHRNGKSQQPQLNKQLWPDKKLWWMLIHLVPALHNWVGMWIGWLRTSGIQMAVLQCFSGGSVCGTVCPQHNNEMIDVWGISACVWALWLQSADGLGLLMFETPIHPCTRPIIVNSITINHIA